MLQLGPARFYFAEMIAATEEIHRLGFIHRDLKPGNFVIDKYGTISCKLFAPYWQAM